MSEIKIWEDQNQLKIIKEMYAPHANEGEFNTFMQIGKATGLNPFLREIWLVKYDKNSPAQIFIGRDGYRKVIGRNPNYAYHQVDAVYSNDEFFYDIQSGQITHHYNLKERGNLVGAYCIVSMRSAEKPFYVFVDIKEYNSGRSLWATKPATMIKKVAECQTIRMALPSELNGTYDPDEMEKLEKVEKVENFISHQEYDSFIKKINECLTEEELFQIGNILKNVHLSNEQRNFLIKYYKNKLEILKNKEEVNAVE